LCCDRTFFSAEWRVGWLCATIGECCPKLGRNQKERDGRVQPIAFAFIDPAERTATDEETAGLGVFSGGSVAVARKT
jgi:hypothetical protein